MRSIVFYPDRLTKGQVGALEPWQVLVALVHLQPSMSDAAGSGYYVESNVLYTLVDGAEVSLADEVDLGDAASELDLLARHGVSITELLREELMHTLLDTL